MSVILAVNESLLKCKVPSDDEAKQIVERVIAKFDNSIDFDADLDLGLDPDAEDFVSKEVEGKCCIPTLLVRDC